MSKAILVTDMPESCNKCDISYTDNFGMVCCPFVGDCNFNRESTEERKEAGCPLKEIPERKELTQYCGRGVLGLNNLAEERFNRGYNACLDKILKGSEI